MQRSDGRSMTQLRSKELRTAYLSQFDGSAYYSQGQTAVVVGVNGPMAARPDQEDINRCIIEVVLTRAYDIPTAGGASRNIVAAARERRHAADAELTQLITRSLEAICMTEASPRCVVQVVVDILRDDGSLCAAVVNATMCALLDAGIPCRTTMAAISMMMISNTAGTRSLLLDPNADEEGKPDFATAASTFVFALPQSGGGVVASVVRSSRGISTSELLQMEAASEKAARVMFEFLRNCSAPLPEEESEVSV